MTYFTFGLIIFQLLTLSQSDKFGTRFSSKADKTQEILQTSESRYQDYTDRDYPNYYRIQRQDFELSDTFKAPHYEANDYWRNKHDNQRTFSEDYSYGPPGKSSTAFPSFYQFMSSIFGGGRGDATTGPPESFYYNHNRETTPPYGHDAPFNYRPTEPNYIPPPKPIRASVIKLETITRPPIFSSFDYETTTKYYPQPGNALNHVLIGNSKPRQNFYPQTVEGLKFPPFKPLPVLPKPGYVLPTTLKPKLYNNHSHYYHYNKTDYKFPESVQDQLPHFTGSEMKIPYVSEKPIPQIFNPVPTELPESQSNYDFYPSTDFRTTTNILDLIDIRGLNLNTERRDPMEGVKSFPGAVEKVNRPTFMKKLTAQLDRGSVERVTNLTIQGFSNPDKDSVNTQQVNYLNVKNLINYEMGKQNATNQLRPVNPNDELSLDAKILKDTNWDGWTTTEVPKETTTFRVVQKNKTAFWEIVEPQSTTTSEFPTESTTTEQIKHRTTTEFIFWTSTPEVEETSTAQETTPKVMQRRFESLQEDPEILEANIQTTTPKRRYNRGPKITNFTPYPSAEEVQKKLVPRNHFPKRQKPNITLSFGNNNVLKNRQIVFGTDEGMKFSDEDLRKRRKIGKRRQVLKRIKVSTSESPSTTNR